MDSFLFKPFAWFDHQRVGLPSTAIGLGAFVDTFFGEGGGDSINLQTATAFQVLVP
jgi:hypothetical protein